MAEIKETHPIAAMEFKIVPAQQTAAAPAEPVVDPSRTQKKNICFTKFFKQEEVEQQRPKWDEAMMEYMCYQIEIAPQTANLHFQGCCIFKKRITLKGAARALGVGWGNGDNTSFMRQREAAINYCQKKESAVEGTFREFGVRPKAGAGDRTDLTVAINECKTLKEMADVHPELVAKYSRGLETVYNMRQKPRDGINMPEIRVYWGTTGSGKSHQARLDGGDDYYSINAGEGLKWWPNYRQQRVCVIEEFVECDPKGVTVSFLLSLLDKYKLTLQTKGGHVEFNSPLIIITSHYHPKDWVPANRWDELKRRITEIRKFRIADNLVLGAGPLETEQTRRL